MPLDGNDNHDGKEKFGRRSYLPIPLTLVLPTSLPPPPVI
jgi:hypothetical protein